MKYAGFWKYALWAAAFGCNAMANATPLPPGWQIRPTTAEDIARGLPAALQTPELAKDGNRLLGVEMVVDLPFSQVLPVVVEALRPVGPLRDEIELIPVSRMSEGWGEVLLSRHPELAQKLVRQVDLPKLQENVREGALAESEIPARLADLERTLRFQPGGERMAPLTERYKLWSGSAKREHGLRGKSSSIVIANVRQLDPVFGRPATSIFLTRNDEYPNPNNNFIGQLRGLADFDVFGAHPPSRLERNSVPEAMFRPVYEALSQLPDANLELGLNAEHWRVPVVAKSRALVREPKLTLPDPHAKALQAQVLLAFEGMDKFTVLADGTVLMLRSYPQALLQWSPAPGNQPRVVWTPADFFTKGLLSRDTRGQSAYLAVNRQLVHFDAATQKLATHPIEFKSDREVDKYIDYFHLGNGVPLAYDHSYRNKRDTLDIWQPTAQPAGDGAPWTYEKRFASLRQGVMREPAPGNLQIKPVRWDGEMPGFWVEDVNGLAELDSENGKVLRAVRLPRRFGEADPQEDRGMAQWTPEPFGSAKGGWIGVGFILIEDKKRTPGVHVVDVASGKVRYSLALPGQETLGTAAPSPDGRLLAMATGSRENAAVLWNLQTGRSLTLRSEKTGCSDLKQLQWTPQGDLLVGRCSNGLLGWDVPSDW